MTIFVWVKVFGSLFALAYGIYATVVDFHVESDGHKRLSRRGRIGMGILIVSSSMTILADYGDKKSAATQKATEQKAQEAITNEQLGRLRELADQLKDAQGTTATISSDMRSALAELTHNTQSVSKVLIQSERALEPLRDLTFLGLLKLPEGDSEVSSLITAVKQSVANPQSSGQLPNGVVRLWEGAGPPGFESRFDTLRNPARVSGFLVHKGSSLYPKAGSGLALLVTSLLVNVQFHSQLSSGSFPGSKLGKPNLVANLIATPNDTSNDLEMTSDGALVFRFLGTVPFANWRSDGTILSVRDLLRAQAAIQPIFSSVMDKDSKAWKIWSHLNIYSLSVFTGDGRGFGFKGRSSAKVEEVPIFVGRFVEPEPVRTLDTAAHSAVETERLARPAGRK